MSWSQNLLECTTAIRLSLYVVLNVHCAVIRGEMSVYKFVSKLYVIAVVLRSLLYFSLVLLFACIARN